MKKICRVLSWLVVMSLVCSCALATWLEYEQVVDIVDAIAIDGQKVFTNPEEYELDSSAWDMPYDCMGAAFVWFADENKGVLQVFDSIYLEKYTQWDCTDITHARVIMDVLPYALPEYVYDMGGEITFIIAENGNANNVIAHYRYNPTYDSGDGIYADANKYSKAVQTAFDNLD